MAVVDLGVDLLEQLGPGGAKDLVKMLNAAQTDTLTLATQGFDARLMAVAAELRQEMAAGDASVRTALVEGLSGIRKEMSDLRVDVIRWSFLFWLGQVAAMATMLSVLLRALGH